MKPLDSTTLQQIRFDLDAHEALLRRIIAPRLAENPPPVIDGQIVATYFFALRSTTLSATGKEIAYHATSGIKDPPPGSLLAECTAQTVAIDPFDPAERTGLIQVAFPLKMLLHPNGALTSVDILHTVAGAVIFDIFEHADARLVSLELPEAVIRGFPGPAHGPAGLRRLTGFPADRPAFGTILKPTAGITPEQVGDLVADAARCDLFLFVKEDENLYPQLDYSPVAERVRRATDAIRRAHDARGGLGLIFAPHITASPHELAEIVEAALEAGATGLMFSEQFAGGIVRMVRELARHRPTPPAIYGHNAGIGVKCRSIWREVIDLLARLDGIDFRQTAPLRPGEPFLRPHGDEWLASEHALSRPLPGIRPTMIVRAGGLDQGNIGLNLADVEARGRMEGTLFLAGSAINSVKNAAGRYDPQLGAQAMREALEVHCSGDLRGLPIDDHLRALAALAERKHLLALRAALRQRYGV